MIVAGAVIAGMMFMLAFILVLSYIEFVNISSYLKRIARALEKRNAP